MKQLYLKTLVLLMMCMVEGCTVLIDCEVDGIHYNLYNEEMTAEVIRGTSYSGAIVIPSTSAVRRMVPSDEPPLPPLPKKLPV